MNTQNRLEELKNNVIQPLDYQHVPENKNVGMKNAPQIQQKILQTKEHIFHVLHSEEVFEYGDIKDIIKTQISNIQNLYNSYYLSNTLHKNIQEFQNFLEKTLQKIDPNNQESNHPFNKYWNDPEDWEEDNIREL